MFIMITLSTILLAALVPAIATAFLLISAKGRLRIIDHPNERSLHSQPMPRTGGIAIWVGIITGVLAIAISFGFRAEVGWIMGAAFIVAAISFIDDRANVPVRIRLIIHLIAGSLLLASGISSPSLWPSTETALPIGLIWLFCLFYMIWMTNLYNFMDGMDGFAGGMAVIGFGTLGLLGQLAGDGYYAAMCWVVAAATAGFLMWNFPPARIFMGDTGSSTLGLLAAGLSLWADRAELFPLWLAVLVFAPFVIDATLTLARRTLKGQRIWEAHRDHYYQRLVQAGWSHRRTVLWEYGLMLLCSAGALLAFQAPVAMQWSMLGGVLAICLAGVFGVRWLEQRRAVGRTSEIHSN
jgi:UDP-N-acetylmuramyl pentapeptide phosphotransferase/UDP-N-acetylglucosamine-1-phosphate transferase